MTTTLPPPSSPSPSHNDSTSTDRDQASACALRRIVGSLGSSRRQNHASKPALGRLPHPSQERLDASLHERSIDLDNVTSPELELAEEKGKTVLYLAYGSNLCNETFRERRGIKPLSQINVQVPSLRLTFDLPGIPYTEPCFANTALRDPSSTADYHKDRWHKGLIGCVYEVSPSDYAHIIATEGGGSAYKDVLVTCYPLPDDCDTVPTTPETTAFKAHTLFAPVADDDDDDDAVRAAQRFSRPDPSYAQPSARYLKLLTDGADELSLPSEYKSYLHQIRAYRITTARQGIAQKLMLATVLPILVMLFGLSERFQDDKGRVPKWLSVLSGAVFAGIWGSYDGVWKGVFGDGERTEGEGGDDEGEDGEKRGWFGGRRREDGGCGV
ncbi:hypothetical protein EJ04DRAFT_494789 [Polyplosphaeria fusca]|uniref:gamma-glutamylcyclotransferase n=1 Tax=Polyplosphaeria fusca TaxID=682080 RepID=A0A9P4QZ59_9PLEO|nr:hypothetical protein EJ04DRAFT_494789 [Polyplosphaeria fusca]